MKICIFNKIGKLSAAGLLMLGLMVLADNKAHALDFIGSGLGTAINGQMGVSTPINNTPLYAPMGANISAQNRYVYQRDARERTVRQRVQLQQNQMRAPILPHDIAPAAGTYQRNTYHRKQTVNMGAIQGSHSYND